MDWALVTWGILIGMVGLLWIMVVASVQDGTSQSPSDDANGEQEAAEESVSCQERYKRQTAA